MPFYRFFLLVSLTFYIKNNAEILSLIAKHELESISINLSKKNTDRSSLILKVSETLNLIDAVEKRRCELSDVLCNSNDNELLLSFVIPCFNRAHTVLYALDSIYSQSYNFSYEVICVDDASSDNTHEVLTNYQNKVSNLIIIRHDKNKGAPAARNTGIVRAKGELIFNLDSDDMLVPGVIQKMVNSYLFNKKQVVSFESAYMFHSRDRIYYPDIKTTAIPSLFPRGYNELGIDYFSDDDVESNNAPWCIAVICKLFTKKSWFKVGGFIDDVGNDGLAFGLLQLSHGYKTFKENNTFYYHSFWENQESKWFVDYNNGASGICVKEALQDIIEVLMPDIEYDLRDISQHDSMNIGHGKISKFMKIIPKKAINYLFDAYENEDTDPAVSLNNYINALKSGVWHLKIYLKAIRQGLKNGSFDKIQDLLVDNKLIRAIKEKKSKEVKKLINEDRGLIFLRDKKWANALHYIVEINFVEGLEYILDNLNRNELRILLQTRNCDGNKPIDLLNDRNGDLINFLQKMM